MKATRQPFVSAFFFGLLLGAALLIYTFPRESWDTPPLSKPPIDERADHRPLPESPDHDTPSLERQQPAKRKISFLVLDQATGTPISDAEVLSGDGNGRQVEVEKLGITRSDGRFESTSPEGDDPREFVARHAGRHAPFGRSTGNAAGLVDYVANIPRGATLRLSIVDANNIPLPAARWAISRRPFAAPDLLSLEAPLQPVPDLSDPQSAVYSGQTDAQGNATVDGLGEGLYFWSATKPGFIPYQNDIGLVMAVPGSHTIRMTSALVAALTIQGDILVSYNFSMPSIAHRDSIRHIADLQDSIARQHGANFAYAAPAEAIPLTRSIDVDIFLRHMGRRRITLTLRPYDPSFEPQVYSAVQPEPSELASGRIHVAVKTRDGKAVEGVAWSLIQSHGRVCRNNRGEQELEVEPGDYTLALVSPTLTRACPQVPAMIRPGEVTICNVVLPHNVFRHQIQFVRQGRPTPTDISYIATILREGRAVEHLTTNGLASSDVWLEPGDYTAKAWIGGFAVKDTLFTVPLNSVSEPCAATPLVMEMTDL